MLAVTGINFSAKINQINLQKKSNQQHLNSQIKPHPINDTISFGGLPGNFGEVVADLCRGAKPNADNLLELKKKGIKFVLDLTNNRWEKEDVEKLGMTYISSKFYKEPYKCESRTQFLDMLKSTAQEIKELLEKGSVFIHCTYGETRTGEAIAAYQYYELKLPEEEILKQAEKYGSRSTVEQLLQMIKD